MRARLIIGVGAVALLLAACPPQKASTEAAVAPAEAAPAAEQTAPAEPSKAADKVGATIGAAPLVATEEILATPDKYKGQKIRVQGKVRGMCHHRRNWFALDVGGEGSYLRIVTEPAFLVPAGSVGKQARAEGVLEVTEINAATARHYAEDHRLGEAPADEAPIKQIVLRATGAEFI